MFSPGKKIRAICPACARVGAATYGYGAITLDDGTQVDDVMRALCDTCSTLVAVAQQSAPTIKAARVQRDEAKRKTRSTVRLPRMLVDFAQMELDGLGGPPERFDLVVKAFALSVLRATSTRRRQIVQALRDVQDPVLEQPLDVSVHLDLNDRMWELIDTLRADAGSPSVSELIRRMLVVMDGDRRTRQDLHHLLLVAG